MRLKRSAQQSQKARSLGRAQKTRRQETPRPPPGFT
jgi:hypothetical protein